MRIIEIEALSNGAHRNQTAAQLSFIPEGWAVVPDDLTTEGFPFGEVVVETVDGVAVVTGWTPSDRPAAEERTPAELREEAYNTQAVIEWDGEQLTVTEASQLWQYYAAEGSAKAAELTALIAAAKANTRALYPDPEVGV